MYNKKEEKLKIEKIKGELNILIQIINNKSNNNINFENNSINNINIYVLDLHIINKIFRIFQ